MKSQATPTAIAPRPWFDPFQWSGLVRAWVLLLFLFTLREYVAVLREVFAPWLPEVRPHDVSSPSVVAAACLLAPFVISQLLALGALFVRAAAGPNTRARREDVKDAWEIANEVISREAGRAGIRRRPIVVWGHVPLPEVSGVFGIAFVLLPRSGLAALERGAPGATREEVRSAFRAVMAHELGHVAVWDDLIFLQWSIYFLSSLLVWCVGVGLWAAGRAEPTMLLRHLLLLAGIALVGRHVVPRREAYCDALAVALSGAEEPLRIALRAMNAASRLRASIRRLWTHWHPRRRLAWLDERGRPFLALARADLALVVFFYILVRTTPLASFRFDAIGALGSAAGPWLDDLVKMTMDVLTVWIVTGATVARAGRALRLRDLVVVVLAGSALQLMLDLIPYGVVSVAVLIKVGSALVVTVLRLLVVTLLLWLTSRLARRFLVEPGSFQNRMRWAAAAIAAVFPSINGIANLLQRLLFSTATSMQQVALGSDVPGAVGLFAISALVLCLYGAGLVILAAISLRGQPPISGRCPGCGAALEAAVLVDCPRCGHLLRPDLGLAVGAAETGGRAPRSRGPLVLLGAAALLALLGHIVDSSPPRDIAEMKERVLRCRGPVMFNTMAFETPEPRTCAIDEVKGADEDVWEWKNAEWRDALGPACVSVYWQPVDRRWLRPASACDFAADKDHVRLVDITYYNEKTGVYRCLLADAAENMYYAHARIHPQRCGRQALTVVRLAEDDPQLAALQMVGSAALSGDEACERLISRFPCILWGALGALVLITAFASGLWWRKLARVRPRAGRAPYMHGETP